MRDYLSLGSSPSGEDCVQVGSDNYYQKMMEETNRYIELLKKKFPDYTEHGCSFSRKSFPHDLGTYHEVVIYYNDENEQSIDFAFNVENNTPEYWE